MNHSVNDIIVIDSDLNSILSFDCSGGSCSTALVVNGKILASRFAIMDRGQAEALLPQIRDVLAEGGLGIQQIDALATTVGPGSFTGLRIGLAAAKGLSLASNKPIMAFSSFEAFMACLIPAHDIDQIVVAIDSKRGPAFVQLFDSARQPLGSPLSLDQDQLDDWLPRRSSLILGDASGRFSALNRPELRIDQIENRINATGIASSASRLGFAGLNRLPLTPLYLRAPDVTQPKNPLR